MGHQSPKIDHVLKRLSEADEVVGRLPVGGGEISGRAHRVDEIKRRLDRLKRGPQSGAIEQVALEYFYPGRPRLSLGPLPVPDQNPNGVPLLEQTREKTPSDVACRSS
mgnify:FL=1